MGFFDFFKKKEEPKKQEPVQKQTTQVTTSQQLQSKKIKLNEEDRWIYDLILQYLVSPVWKVQISEFLDEYCINFDDEEENKFEHFTIHKKFTQLMESLIDGMIAELGLSEEIVSLVIEKGLKQPKHQKYFEQLLVADNFLVFKKLMIKRNKENELEALTQLQAENNNGASVQPQDLKRAELDKEKAELEHVLAMSQAVEEERLRILQDEENMLMEAIRQSELEYQQQSQIQEKQEVVQSPQQAENKVEVQQTQEQAPVEKKKQQRLEPLTQNPKPQVIKFEEFETSQDRNLIQAQIEKIKQQQQEAQKEEKEESAEDRKKRLMAQRELIRKKKQAEREQQLKEYQEEQKQQLGSQTSTSNQEQRKLLLEQRKQQIVLGKIKDELNFQEDLL